MAKKQTKLRESVDRSDSALFSYSNRGRVHSSVRYDFHAMLERAWKYSLTVAMGDDATKSKLKRLCSDETYAIFHTVLLACDELYEPKTVGELIKLMQSQFDFDEKTIRQRLAIVEADGFVKKHRCTKDKRKKNLRPTDRLRDFMKLFDALQIDIMSHVLHEAEVTTNLNRRRDIPAEVFVSIEDKLRNASFE